MTDVSNLHVQALVTEIQPQVTNLNWQAIVTEIKPVVSNLQVQALFTDEDVEFTDYTWSWLPSYAWLDNLKSWVPLFRPSDLIQEPPYKITDNDTGNGNEENGDGNGQDSLEGALVLRDSEDQDWIVTIDPDGVLRTTESIMIGETEITLGNRVLSIDTDGVLVTTEVT